MKQILVSSIVFMALCVAMISKAPAVRPEKGPALAGYYYGMALQKEKLGIGKSLGLGAMQGGLLGFIMGSAAMGIRDNPTDAIKVMAASTTLGALRSALLDAYGPWTTSPAWTAQLKKLEDTIKARPGEIIADQTVLIGGIPTDVLRGNVRAYLHVKDYLGRPYLLSAKYHNTSDLNVGKSYWFYLMPKDENLVDIFLLLNGASKNSKDENIKNVFENVACIAFSLRPDVSKSVWTKKNLPRIIIGMKQRDEKRAQEEATMFAFRLSELLGGYSGIGYRPWYSAEIEVPDGTNKLIYASYGDGDYKETEKGQEEYVNTKNRSWRSWISSDVEDMAYKNNEQRIDITNMPSNRAIIRDLIKTEDV